LGDKECEDFERVIRKLNARRIIEIVETGQVGNGTSPLPWIIIYDHMMVHICNCEKHRNPQVFEDDCSRFEVMNWLKQYVFDALEQPAHEEDELVATIPVEEIGLFQIEHARGCERHKEELEELEFTSVTTDQLEMSARAIAAKLAVDPNPFPKKEQIIAHLLTIGHANDVDDGENN
jgi:hypothetical protein